MSCLVLRLRKLGLLGTNCCKMGFLVIFLALVSIMSNERLLRKTDMSTFNSDGSTPCESQPSDDGTSKKGAENVVSPVAKRQKLDHSCPNETEVDNGRQLSSQTNCINCGLELGANVVGSHQKCKSALALVRRRLERHCPGTHLIFVFAHD